MTFSLPGLILSLAILAPNFLLLAWPPRNPPATPATTGWLLSALEKGGQAACLLAPALTGRDAGLDGWLVAVIAFVGVYYGLWTRYFARGRDFALLYSRIAFVPVPMAVFPVLAFLAGAGWLHSWWLAGAAVLLAAGHIPSALIIARSTRTA